MDYQKKLKYHYRPKKGWVNDPNGLVYFKGYYHIFYQHTPEHEYPVDPMCWGHARTKDFLEWEELPVALKSEFEHENHGCWSGTAVVKDDILYIIYSSVNLPKEKKNDPINSNIQTVSVAYSTDGITFKKYENNPVISSFPKDGSRNFRDPAICFNDGKYYLVMASGHVESKKARLLLYESENIFDWEYKGIMAEEDDALFYECPSFMKMGDKFLLSASVCTSITPLSHHFSLMSGTFRDSKFSIEASGEIDKGPDQYAGQIFKDEQGRCILISWIPGWEYINYYEKDIGCFSSPREISVENGKIKAYPVEEVRHLLKDTDQSVKITLDGFIIERTNRSPVIYKGKIDDIKILRDEYVVEVFVNGGEEVYTALL